MRPLFTTVVTPATTRALITLADLREQLRIKPNDTANDAWMTKVIARCSRQAERYCNRVFVPQGYSETFSGGVSGDNGEPLILSQAPVDPATFTITIDGSALLTTDYGLDQYAALVYRLTQPMFWTSTSSLVVAYTAGFAPTIPDDVQQAVLDLCVGENSGRGRDPMLRANEAPGLGRQEFWVGGLPGGAMIPQDIASLLNPYRRGLIG